jgi:osmotically inducible protein OsmC
MANTVRGEVGGLDEAGFVKAAKDAKLGCPVGEALTGTMTSLEAALA